MDAGGTPSIKRYNPDGTPADFSALGTNTIDGMGTGDETPQNGLGFASASESQIAVDNSGGATDGNIYVTQNSPNVIDIFSSAGAYLGQLSAAGATDFAEACGVAVDPSGAVYVGDYSSGIHKFVPAANPPVNADNTATFTTVSQPCTLAAGAGPTAGFLFAAQYVGPISKIDSSTGDVKYEVSLGSNMTVAVDPGSGHVYGATESTIKEVDASGAGGAISVGSTQLTSSVQGIAIDEGSGDIYASRSGSAAVEVFDGAITVFPGVTTNAATDNTGQKRPSTARSIPTVKNSLNASSSTGRRAATGRLLRAPRHRPRLAPAPAPSQYTPKSAAWRQTGKNTTSAWSPRTPTDRPMVQTKASPPSIR